MTPRNGARPPGGIRIAVALIALLALPGSALAQGEDDPAALLAAGEAAHDAGDYELARERLWSYLEATGDVTGPSRLPQARALYLIARMEPDVAEARRHYETIVEEYPAATEASQAAFRLGVLALMEGRSGAARERFRDLDRAYPFSRVQPELPLWIGRTYLEEQRYVDATDAFLDGYTKVKSQDLPTELPLAQREALAAEYAWWLAKAFREEGDERTARQYYSLLVLDYPESPQAEEARLALEAGEGELVERAPRPEEPEVEPVGDAEEIARAEPDPRQEPAETPPPEPIPGPEEVDPRPETDVRREVDVPTGGEPAGPEGPAAEEPPAGEPVAEAPADREPTPEEGEAEAEDGGVVADPADRRADVGPAALVRRPVTGVAHLQVGAFTSAARAADLSKRLKADGFDTLIEIAVVDGQGFYRVRVGPFQIPAEEERLETNRRRLTERGYPAETVREER